MGIQRINVVGVPVDVCRPEDLETEILEVGDGLAISKVCK